MFALGFEENTDNSLTSIRKCWSIAFFGAVAPFFAADAVAEYLWSDYHVSLMCGLTMTATAVSLTMISLKAEGLSQSPVATRIMNSAVLDDIASLGLPAALVPVSTGAAPIDPLGTLAIADKAVAFFLLV